MRLALRYDMRAPAFGASSHDLYRAAVEQCEWADNLGFDTVYLAEHHAAEDGYCPAPIVQAAAIASRTSRIALHFSALIGVLHHPLRLAEDLAVLDLISQGRVEMTLGMGYRPHEYEMFGIERRRRVARLEELVEVLKNAWTGEPFEFRGSEVRILPRPFQRPRPPIYLGGSSEAAARRAARLADDFQPPMGQVHLTEAYQAERRLLGLPVPPPPPHIGPLFVFVTDDPDQAWPVVAPHVIYNANTYAEWAKERGLGSTPYPKLESVEDCRKSSQFAVVTPAECVELAASLPEPSELVFQPLIGGTPPDVAWSSLELFESAVLPELKRLGLRSESNDASQRDRALGS